jgi:hypothetical protein
LTTSAVQAIIAGHFRAPCHLRASQPARITGAVSRVSRSTTSAHGSSRHASSQIPPLVGAGLLARRFFLVGVGGATPPMSSPWGNAEAMVAAIPTGTDVRMAVPASPPLRMTIRACSMIAVRNAACRSIAASQREGRCCVCAPVISDCRTDPLLIASRSRELDAQLDYTPAPGGSGFRYTIRQQQQIPSPIRGYFRATPAATPKRPRVTTDRIRMTLRALGDTSSTGLRSISPPISKT